MLTPIGEFHVTIGVRDQGGERPLCSNSSATDEVSSAMLQTSRPRVTRPVQLGIHGLRIGPADTVVDVGCGVGSICRYAGQAGAAVIGIDSEPSLIDQADESMREVPARSWRGIVSDCDPIPLPDGTATLVFCTEVLEHVDDPARFVAELVRIGRPGALYHVSVPDPASEGLLRQVAPSWYWEPPFHRRVFQHHELDALLRGAGLRIERREQGGSYHTVRWLLWWTLGRDPYDVAENADLMMVWDRIWDAIMAAPHSALLLRGLEATLPKSQTVLASRPGACIAVRLRPLLMGRGLNWLKNRVRSGGLRIGGLKISWSVDRSRRAG